ncbi:hypothetical protein AC579_2935 [Pseudocercospora musae]|uniref:Uncharacterized protein n=1 Tax=Pseudocercospora musae TaxID=113226 RepID=A0A139ITW9_9PEZI|nr:hypothetical protein AC579_2935 [Pseudocercospora musae]
MYNPVLGLYASTRSLKRRGAADEAQDSLDDMHRQHVTAVEKSHADSDLREVVHAADLAMVEAYGRKQTKPVEPSPIPSDVQIDSSSALPSKPTLWRMPRESNAQLRPSVTYQQHLEAQGSTKPASPQLQELERQLFEFIGVTYQDLVEQSAGNLSSEGKIAFHRVAEIIAQPGLDWEQNLDERAEARIARADR